MTNPSPTLIAALAAATCILAGCASSQEPGPSTPPTIVGTVAFGNTGVPVLQSVRCDKSVPPRFPAGARRQGIQGVGVVRVIVNEIGEPVDFAVIDSRPTVEFGQSVLEAARQWKYYPVNGEDGHPIVYAVEIPVTFNGEKAPPLPPVSSPGDRPSSYESFPR